MEVVNGRLWHLKRFDLLGALTSKQLEELNGLVKEATYEEGESIYLPGDPSHAVYFLKQGRVKVSYLDESGKRLTLAICGRGEPFGEMALVGEERRGLEASALEDVWLCWIAKDDLLRFASKVPQLSLRVAKLIGWRRHKIENRLEDLLFKDVPTRLARMLWKLGTNYGEETKEGVRIRLRLTHQNLAELIGATRETTTTVLNHFQEKGLIEKSWGVIIIKDQAKLKERAQLQAKR